MVDGGMVPTNSLSERLLTYRPGFSFSASVLCARDGTDRADEKMGRYVAQLLIVFQNEMSCSPQPPVKKSTVNPYVLHNIS